MKDKPSVKLKALWYTVWVIWLVVFLAVIIVLVIFAGLLAAAIVAALLVVATAGLLFWIPAAYRQAEYSVREEGVRMNWGVVWRKQVTVPYTKITNVDITRGLLERLLGIATLHLQTAGAGGQQGQKAELKLPGIKDPELLSDMVVEKIIQKVVPSSYEGKTEFQIIAEILEQIKAIATIIKSKS